MSEYATETRSRKRGRKTRGEIQDCWERRITQARNNRRRYEMQWHLNQAFLAGHHYLEWSKNERKLVFPSLLNQRVKRGLQLYKADLITQYVWTAIASLRGDGDFRSELAFIRDDLESEDYAKAANDAFAFAWDNELQADKIIDDLLLYIVSYGTAAGRCRFDPTIGETIAEQVPFLNGKPLLDPEQAQAAVEASFMGQGPQVQMRELKGQIVWDALTPFNLLPPPGLADPGKFPWEITVDARLVSTIEAEYPQADGLKGQDLTAVDLVGLRDTTEMGGGYDESMEDQGKLEDHALVYTCFERPCPDYPQGMVAVLAGSEPTLLDVRYELPYQAPGGGEYRSGITYFHYWKVPNRFWGRALVEAGIGQQRAYNKRRTQTGEIIDRGMPYTLEEEGSIVAVPRGLPMERVKMAPGRRPPTIVSGIGPGPWMNADLQTIKEDLAAAMGIEDVALGQNPERVGTYSQLVLLNERNDKKAEPITNRFRQGLDRMSEDTVYDIRKYWPPDKVIALEGESGLLESKTFTASKMPQGYYVRRPKGAALPRTQAAELAKVSEIAQYCASIGVPLPPDWFKDSLDAGKPLPLPEMPANAHIEKARWENELLLKGVPPQAAPFDDHAVHIPSHRELQIRLSMAGPEYEQLVMMLDQHCQEHAQLQVQAEATQIQTDQSLTEAGASAVQASGVPSPEDQALAEQQAGQEQAAQIEQEGAKAQINAALQQVTQQARPAGGGA